MKKNFQSPVNAIISIENSIRKFAFNIPPGLLLPGGVGLKNLVIKSSMEHQRAAGHFAQLLGFTRFFYYVIH